MATRSLLFAMIGIVQIVALTMSLLCHFPKMVVFGWKNFALTDPTFAGELMTKDHKLMYGLWRHCVEGEPLQDSCKMIKGFLVFLELDLRCESD